VARRHLITVTPFHWGEVGGAEFAPLGWPKFLSKNKYHSLRVKEFAAQCQVLLMLLLFFKENRASYE